MSVVTQYMKSLWADKQKSTGMTQAEAAAILGWTQSAFSQYINGRLALNPKAAIKLATLLDVHPARLYPDLKQLLDA